MSALSDLGNDILPLLKQALNDSNKSEESRKYVMIILGELKDKSVLNYLIKMMLEERSWHLRYLAAYSLDVYQDDRTYEPLQKALKDPFCVSDESDSATLGREVCPVRQAAFSSLLKLGFRQVGCPPVCVPNVYIMKKLPKEEFLAEKNKDKENARKLKEYLSKPLDELMAIIKSGTEPEKTHALKALTLRSTELSKKQLKEFEEELKKRMPKN